MHEREVQHDVLPIESRRFVLVPKLWERDVLDEADRIATRFPGTQETHKTLEWGELTERAARDDVRALGDAGGGGSRPAGNVLPRSLESSFGPLSILDSIQCSSPGSEKNCCEQEHREGDLTGDKETDCVCVPRRTIPTLWSCKDENGDAQSQVTEQSHCAENG